MEAFGVREKTLISEAVVLRERLQRRLRPRADMLDHFGGRQCAELRGGAVILAAREPDQEAGGEQIARAGRIDQLVDRHGLHRLDCSSRDTTTQPFSLRVTTASFDVVRAAP